MENGSKRTAQLWVLTTASALLRVRYLILKVPTPYVSSSPLRALLQGLLGCHGTVGCPAPVDRGCMLSWCAGMVLMQQPADMSLPPLELLFTVVRASDTMIRLRTGPCMRVIGKTAAHACRV